VSLLSLVNVSKTVREGAREHIVLRDVSLQLDSGEYAVVWGLRGSGRSTLLRVATGIEAPDGGTVCFEGRKLPGGGEALGEGIGYCHLHLGFGEGRGVLDHVVMGLLACGVRPASARSRAEHALELCGALECRKRQVSSLDRAEAVRVALARTLALEPRLLVIDDPTHGVELLQRDGILMLLRKLANAGIAVLASTGESTGLSGADRMLALSEGRLRGNLTPQLGTVVPLHEVGRQRAIG
jgi:energy-coupling factor transporter ATP-binding protein EcfA2